MSDQHTARDRIGPRRIRAFGQNVIHRMQGTQPIQPLMTIVDNFSGRLKLSVVRAADVGETGTRRVQVERNVCGLIQRIDAPERRPSLQSKNTRSNVLRRFSERPHMQSARQPSHSPPRDVTS